jgi:hypothetical protein
MDAVPGIPPGIPPECLVLILMTLGLMNVVQVQQRIQTQQMLDRQQLRITRAARRAANLRRIIQEGAQGLRVHILRRQRRAMIARRVVRT